MSTPSATSAEGEFERAIDMLENSITREARESIVRAAKDAHRRAVEAALDEMKRDTMNAAVLALENAHAEGRQEAFKEAAKMMRDSVRHGMGTDTGEMWRNSSYTKAAEWLESQARGK